MMACAAAEALPETTLVLTGPNQNSIYALSLLTRQTVFHSKFSKVLDSHRTIALMIQKEKVGADQYSELKIQWIREKDPRLENEESQ